MINKDTLKLGATVGLASTLLAYIFGNLLKGFGATITFATYDVNVRQQLEQGIATGATKTLSEKFLGLISGLIPATFQEYALVFIAGIITVVVGQYLVDLLNVKVKNQLWAVMVAGTVGLSAIVKFTSVLTLSYIPVLVGLGIYFAIVTFAIDQLVKNKVIPSNWVG